MTRRTYVPIRKGGETTSHLTDADIPNERRLREMTDVRTLCGQTFTGMFYTHFQADRWQVADFPRAVHPCTACTRAMEALPSRTRDVADPWGKQRVANVRRAAALTIITSVLDETDRQAEEEGEPPDLLQYLDDVARHLLTIVEDPS